jgi:hypothetical protein
MTMNNIRKYRVNIRYEFDVLATSEDDAMSTVMEDLGTLVLDSDYEPSVKDVDDVDWDDFYPINTDGIGNVI